MNKWAYEHKITGRYVGNRIQTVKYLPIITDIISPVESSFNHDWFLIFLLSHFLFFILCRFYLHSFILFHFFWILLLHNILCSCTGYCNQGCGHWLRHSRICGVVPLLGWLLLSGAAARLKDFHQIRMIWIYIILMAGLCTLF